MRASIGRADAPLSYSIDRAMAVTGLGRTKIYDLMKDGTLESFKVGKRTLITARSIQRMIDAAVEAKQKSDAA